MMSAERIQALIHKLEVDAGARWLKYAALALMVLALAVWYDTHCYHGFQSREAMDAAQVARNLADGKGYTTDFIRPFSIYLLQKHHRAQTASALASTNFVDTAEVYGPHPDLANAPLYPLVLAGLFKLTGPDWNVELHKVFWSDSGRFLRYRPEFTIAIFNQLLLLVVVVLAFLLARAVLDTQAAWLVAVLLLFSDELWKYSVSGLPTLLLMVIFLGLVWCLVLFESQARAENSGVGRRFALAVAAGVLTGLGMLTHYSFGWLILPVAIFVAALAGTRRTVLAAVTLLTFAATVCPWIIRNYAVSGTPLGTAGFAVIENSYVFSGSRLMRSLDPEMYSAYRHIVYLMLVKLKFELPGLQNDLLRLGGGWIGILFLAGLLLGLRNVAARRLRYFVLMCLGTFLIITPLGRTALSEISPEMNTENLLALLTPLVAIFGVAFFLTLLNQMELPSVAVRLGVVVVVAILACQQMILTLLPPRISPVAYPPYWPPDIQRFSVWIHPDELMMSDIPWAVAWYGGRQCSWTTINSRYEFSQLNDYIKHVSALYLSRDLLDARLCSDCLQGVVDSWSSFVFERIGAEKIKQPDATETWGRIMFRANPNELRDYFPLNSAPSDIYSGLFLADYPRWKTQ